MLKLKQNMERQVCYRAIGERAVVSFVSIYLEIWMAKPPLLLCVVSKGVCKAWEQQRKQNCCDGYSR